MAQASPSRRSSRERRRELRVNLSLLVRVEGFDADRGSWTEFTTTRNASSGGVSFAIDRRLQVGQMLKLHIMLPFAKQLRQEKLKEPFYGVYAVVRDVRRENGGSQIGAMFFGEQPPKGFDRNPGALYLLPWDVSPEGWRNHLLADDSSARSDSSPRAAPRDRRAFPRYEVSVDFVVQHVDEWEAILAEGLTVAENLSRGGALLLTTTALTRGDMVILKEIGGVFVTRAEVTGFDFDEDGARHVRVRFLGAEGPDHLIPREV